MMVAEIDPARRLQAAYDGWHVVDLQRLSPRRTWWPRRQAVKRG
nr:Uncharacterised protein [Klebsiella pneumoniae]